VSNLDDRILDIVHCLEREGKLGNRFKGPTPKNQIRFGTHGSIAIEIGGAARGSWYDHEREIGGGPFDLIWDIGGHPKGQAFDNWVLINLGLHHQPDGRFTDPPSGNRPRIEKTYDYVDEQGLLLFQVVRFVDHKFLQRRPDGKGGWIWKLGDTRRVLYHLPELIAAKATGNAHPWRVYIPEGEKDVDRLRDQWGVTATCNPGGAGKWRREYSPYFTGAQAVLLADNDQAGRNHVAAVASMLAPFAAVIKIVYFDDLREKGDISNWIDAGGTQGDLEDLVDSTENANIPDLKPQAAGFDDEVWPEPALLVDDEWATPLFPSAFLPGPLGEFAAQQAFDLQVPLDYFAIPLLISAATAIGREFRIAPKAHAGWTERACLWGGIIGYVGDGKTPSFNAALGPIWTLQAKFRDEFQGLFETWQTKVKLAKAIDKQWQKDLAKAVAKGLPAPDPPAGAAAPERPIPRQLVANDATQEKLAELMHHNPRGIMLYRDELSGWFRSFNQYRPGSDEQFYLQCHAGGPWHQQRKSGDYTIADVYLSICGGFQPDIVAEVLACRPGKADSGMAARFSLLVWPDHMPRQWVDNSPDPELRAQVTSLFRGLLSKDPEAFVGPRPEGASHFAPLRFAPEAQEVFRDWYIAHQHAQDALDYDYSPLRGHFAKYDGLFAQLALVHHLIRHTLRELVVPALVDEQTALAVRSFIEDYLRPHARKIYRHLGRDPGYDGARRIARWILDNPDITSFTARDISRKQWAGLTGRNVDTGKDHLRAALEHLDTVAGWVRTDEIPAGPRGGRSKFLYVINPRIAR
jgi:hypothetical protein